MVSRFPFYRRSSSWLSAVLPGSPVRLRDCRRALPLGATAGALYLPAGVSGAKRSERRQRAGRGAERSEAERSPPCPPSMSFPVLSCLCSLLSPCLLVGSSPAGMLFYRAGAPCRPFPCWPGWGALPLGRAGGDKEVVPAGRNREV